MKLKPLAILLLALVMPPAAWGSALPDWAAAAVQKAAAAPVPSGADRWVLLDRTEFAYAGNGEIRTHRYRVIKVLSDRGTDAAVFELMGLGGGASKVKKLKGWNLRPNGELEKLDSDNVIAIEKPGDSSGVDDSRLTGAVLGRVVKGSYVAFESLESFYNPGGPSDMALVMERDPVLRWEFTVGKHEGWFSNLSDVGIEMDLRHFSPWIASLKVVPNQEASADQVPALPKGEGDAPWFWNALPRVQIRFLDPALREGPDLKTWDGLAAWVGSSYSSHAAPSPLPGVSAGQDAAGLKAISGWMSHELTYKQVYLSPERGLVPLDAADVVRRRYGDCKDLSACFIAAARSAGFKAYPVLARIGEGRIEADEPVFMGAFNHMISAIRLDKTMGLAAEVETPEGRFLLVDPTARLTPLGYLPDDHRGGRVMICAGRAGIWVPIPDSAIEPQSLKVKLEGAVEANGRLAGKLHLEEAGDAAGLRSAALGLTAKELTSYLLDNLLSVPADGILEVLGHGDPLDLSKPFSLDARLVHPRGLVVSGGEADLDALGIFRVLPEVIQPPGQPRAYPVEQEGSSLLEVQAELQFPARVSPLLPEATLDDPFRSLSWSAKAVPSALGCMLSLQMSKRMKPAYFGFGDQEKGLAAWSKHRKESRAFLDDALAFKLQP